MAWHLISQWYCYTSWQRWRSVCCQGNHGRKQWSCSILNNTALIWLATKKERQYCMWKWIRRSTDYWDWRCTSTSNFEANWKENTTWVTGMTPVWQIKWLMAANILSFGKWMTWNAYTISHLLTQSLQCGLVQYTGIHWLSKEERYTIIVLRNGSCLVSWI